jgi:hypothetical protein
MLTLLALAGLAAWSVTAAWAGPNPDWAAKYEGQCCYLNLESGQVGGSAFNARNVGAKTWDRSFVDLGTVNSPYYTNPTPDRNSAFYIPGDWLNQARPARLDQATVPPQGVGSFSFRVRAPQVSQVTTYIEHFAPVAEGIAWMGCDDGCQWGNVWLRYTVYPPQNPAVAISDGPRTVTQGEPIDVSASASDPSPGSVNRVEFTLEDQKVVDTTAPYAARFSTATLDPGGHVVTAKAFDNAGHSASDAAGYSVKASEGSGVQQPPTDQPVPDVGVSINGGQAYTNSPVVSLTLRPPQGATEATISNDGLVNPTTVPLNGELVSWTLDSSGPERLPKTVYVHFKGPGIDSTAQHTDDIILDETAPKVDGVIVTPARRGNRRIRFARIGFVKVGAGLVKPRCSAAHLRLKVKAHDNVSHVSSLSYRFTRHSTATNVKFESNVPVKVPPKLHPTALFVAVRDGALNLSKVHKISLRRVCR